jgi:hypothetical protein
VQIVAQKDCVESFAHRAEQNDCVESAMQIETSPPLQPVWHQGLLLVPLVGQQ